MASKRELDKESMFRKIMPSAAHTQAADSKTDAAAAGAPLPEDAPLPVVPPAENAALQTAPAAALKPPAPQAEPIEPIAMAPAPTPQAGDGGKLSQDAIAALFAQQDNTDSIPDAPTEPAVEPEPPTPQAEPIELVAAAPTPQAGDSGKLSPDAIAALFAQQDNTDSIPDAPVEPAAALKPPTQQAEPIEPIAMAPAPTPQAGDGGKLSPDAIAALFAHQDNTDSISGAPTLPAAAPEPPAQQGEPIEPVAAVPAPTPQAGDGGKLSPTAIAAIFAQQHAKTEALAAEDAGLPVFSDNASADTAPAGNAHTHLSAASLPESPAAKKVAAAETDPATAPHPVNLAAVFVEQCYPRYQKRLEGCSCAKCRDDVCGMALNRIKPRYTTSDRFEPSLLNDHALITESVTALIHALFVVKRNPNHNPADI